MQTILPPLDLENSALGPEPLDLVTATVTLPLLHAAFSLLKSLPTGPNTSIIYCPVSAAFNLQGSSAVSTLYQKIESDCRISSPLPSPLRSTISDKHTSEQSQSIIIKDEEGDVAGIWGTQPLSPISPTLPTMSPSSTALEKMKCGGMALLVVMNLALPPPYSPRSPLSSKSSPIFAATSTPAITHPPLQAVDEWTGSTLPTSLFLPHLNAPKPNLSLQGLLYRCVMELVPSLPSNLLIQTMCRATQMCVMPNSLLCFSTIYRLTIQDLSAVLGPMPILFSTDPPNNIPAQCIAMATALPPVTTSIQNMHSPVLNVQQLPVWSQAIISNFIPWEGFVPKTRAAHPHSHSFSGFDLPLSAGMPPNEQRFVLNLIFQSHMPCNFVLLKDGVMFLGTWPYFSFIFLPFLFPFLD